MAQRYWEVGTFCYQEELAGALQELRWKADLPFTMHEVEATSPFYMVAYGYDMPEAGAGRGRVLSKIYEYYLTQALVEIVCEHWEKSYIEKLLRKRYDLTAQQRQVALQKCAGQDQRRRKALAKAILDYIDKHSSFCIEGFMNFQASFYKQILCKEIEQAVRSIEWEEEEQEFVEFMRRILGAKGVRLPVLHMVIDSLGQVFLYDGEHKRLLPEKEDAYEVDAGRDKKELYADLLVRFLLQLAPGMMVVHARTPVYADLLRMLEQVFDERFHCCKGCSLCLESH